MSKITFDKLSEIIEKEYTINELSYWERMLNQSLSGNFNSLLSDGISFLYDVSGEWINDYYGKNGKKEEEKDIYIYKESIEKRLIRLYKEMNRI